MALSGAVTLDQLIHMPLRQYRVLKLAVELVQIERRERYVYDTAHAFSDPKKAFSQLNEMKKELTHSEEGGVRWDTDKDAAERAKKFMR